MPFSSEQFFEVFESYAVTTAAQQWVLLALCGLAIALSVRPRRRSGMIISLILAAMWFWSGLVYHIMFFSTINPASLVFGTAFLIQASIFLFVADRLTFRIKPGAAGIFGVVLLIYTFGIYPLLGEYLGHHYPRRPTIGTPCSTTIFTFGILLFLRSRPRLYIYLIPLIWSLIGSSAAYLFGVYEDLGLFVAGVGGSLFLSWKHRSPAA